MAQSNRGPLGLAVVLGVAAIGFAAWWLLGRDAAPPDRAPDADRAAQQQQDAAAAQRTAQAAAAEEAARQAAAEAEAKAEAKAMQARIRSASDGSELRIPSHGRMTLRHETLPEDGPLVLSLDLPDEARGTGDRTVRIVSAETGRRVDLLASPLPGEGSGVRLEIDPAVLEPGRYLIEIDTVASQPLQIRRYVLEIR